MDTRVAIISIIVEEGSATDEVNAVLHEFNSIIIGRMGIPYRKKDIGIISIAAGLEGYLEGNLNWIFRILLIAAGLLLLVPGTLTDVVGIAALAIVFAFQILRRRKAQPA